MQQSLLNSTVAVANVREKAASGSGNAFALAAENGLSHAVPERRADDLIPLGLGGEQDAAYGYRTPRVIPAFREHLFYGLLLDMKAMYRRGAVSAPVAGTRSFCRYMADRIDRVLALD
ncbi:MAG: hypothetical protein V8Q54_06100 [Alistipes senegalensis]